MAESTQVISFKASVAFEPDMGSLSQVESEAKNKLKEIKIPVGADVNKASIKEVASTIKNHIHKTGIPNFEFKYDSKDLDKATDKLNDLSKRYKTLEKIKNENTNKINKRDYEDSDLAKKAASKVSEVSKKTYKDDKYKSLYNEAETQYNNMHKNSRNAISLNDFREYAMAAMLAQEGIDSAYKELDGLTSKKDWSKNADSLKRAGELRNQINSNQAFIKELTNEKTGFAGTSGFQELFKTQGIDYKNILDPVQQDMFKNVSNVLNKSLSSTGKQMQTALTKVRTLTDKYTKQWEEILSGEGFEAKGYETLDPFQVPEDGTKISAQQYNAAKKNAEKLNEKHSKGEELSKEELQKADYYKRLVESYKPKEGSTTTAVDKNVLEFLQSASDQWSLMNRQTNSDFKMPSDMNSMSDKDLLSTHKNAKEYISQFVEKIKNNEQIYAEEGKGLQEALATIDKYREIHKEKAREDKKPEPIYEDSADVATARKWESQNGKDLYKIPFREDIGKETSSKAGITENGQNANVTVTANTEQLEQALASVESKINELDNKTVTVTLTANDESLNAVEEKINSIKDIEGNPIDIRFNANVDDLNATLQDIATLKDNMDVSMDFKGNVEEIEKAVSSAKEIKEVSQNKDGQIDLKVDDSQLEKAESALNSLREKAQAPIEVTLNTNGILDDLIAVESIINDLKKNLDFKVKFNTGQSFSDKKATDIETMTNKIATLADKSTTYSAKIASSFAGVGSSVREVTRLVTQLNAEFNLTGEISAGLKSMNKLLAGGKVSGSDDGSALGLSNPKSARIKSAAQRAEAKSIASVDLSGYTTEFATKVESTLNRIADLKAKHSSGEFFDNAEVEKDISLINKLNAELTEYGRIRNQFKLQNNQGTVIGENIDLSDFNEAKAEELFRASGINSNVLETSMGKNGMSAYIKARSRDDGKLEKYAINYDQNTGLARSQLKSRSEYKSLFGQVVGDIGQEVTKLSKYLVSMGGIDVVWQGFQKGIESVKEMDAAMTELKKVTSDTSDVYATVEKDMYATGKDIGRDAVELTKSTADWARLGYGTQDAEKMSKWTGILMNVSEFEQVDDATNALISIMQGFNKSADDVENVVDVLNNIGNLEPISTDEIASSLQRSAAALQAAGTSYEQSVALTTVGNEILQNPESVGNALKVVSMRIRGTDTKTLEEAGEDSTGLVTSVSQLRDLIRSLTKVSSNDFKGFDILKDDGSYKNPYEVMLGLGKIWNEIGSQDQGDLKQASILEKIAGKNRANVVSNLLTHSSDLEKVYNETQNSEGSALRENETQLDSIQGKVDQLTASFQEMWNTTISSDFAKGLVDIGTDITNLVTKAGLLKTAFAGALGVAGTQGKLGRANYQLSSCTMPRAI